MKFKLFALIIAIALLSYLCGFGVSLAISKNIFQRGSASGHKYNGQGKPDRGQKIQLAPTPTVELIEFSNQVKAGEQAYIRVRTLPGSICTIYFIDPDRHFESLPGQIFQITGDDGLCGWTWATSPELSAGNAVVYLSAGGNLQQYTFTIIR